MASGSLGQPGFKRAIQAMTTSVGMATVSSEYKTISDSILKATNHAEVLPKEKHIGIILHALSGSRPRADVAYCIHALKKRFTKTHSWVVAVKTLIVIHRALREVDTSFFEELSFQSQHRGHIYNLLHFRDESTPSACDCSSWIRKYALYIDEYLNCFHVLKYDFCRDHTRIKELETPALLAQLPALQQLLLRLLCCQPVGAARYNYMIQYALSIIATESVRLYVAITDGVLILVDKFFEMKREDAVPALEIYRRAVEQAQRLSDFFEMCRGLEFGRTQKYVEIEQPPASFLTAMEGYIKDAPQPLVLPWTSNGEESATPKLIAIHDPKKAIAEEGSHSSDECENNSKKVDLSLIPDLLSWDEPSREDSESMAAPDNLSETTIDSQVSSEATGWELAVATVPTPNATPLAVSKGGVLQRTRLESLYQTSATKPSTNGACPMPTITPNPLESADRVYVKNVFHGGYNQNMFYYPAQSYIQVPETFQHPAASMHQQGSQGQPIMVYDYMQIAGIPHQQPQFTQQQQSSPYVDVSKHIMEMRLTELPVQQQEKPIVGHHSTGSFGNPFME